jgi:hypothetical protein
MKPKRYTDVLLESEVFGGQQLEITLLDDEDAPVKTYRFRFPLPLLETPGRAFESLAFGICDVRNDSPVRAGPLDDGIRLWSVAGNELRVAATNPSLRL